MKGAYLSLVALLLGAASAMAGAVVTAVPAAASGPATLTPINGTTSSGPVGVVSYHYDYSNNCLNFSCLGPSTHRIVLDFERYTQIGESSATVYVSTDPSGSGWSHTHAYGDVSGTIPDWPRSRPTTYSLTAWLVPANGPPAPGTEVTVTYTVTTVTPTFNPNSVTPRPAPAGTFPAGSTNAGAESTQTAATRQPVTLPNDSPRGSWEAEREAFGGPQPAECPSCQRVSPSLVGATGGQTMPGGSLVLAIAVIAAISLCAFGFRRVGQRRRNSGI